MAGGKIGARAGIWVHRGYSAGADRVRDRRMDFHEAGDCAREYVFAFVGGSDSGSGGAGGHRTFVFWGKRAVGEEKVKRFNTEGTEGRAQSSQRRKKQEEEKCVAFERRSPPFAKGAKDGAPSSIAMDAPRGKTRE